MSRELYDHFETVIREAVTHGDRMECSPDFMGFLNVYYPLSKIIPKDMKVADLGCGHGAQSFYFKEHEDYIGVDAALCHVLTDGLKEKFHNMTIYAAIRIIRIWGCQDEYFLINSYVPDWLDGNCYDFIRENFPNYYLYYPGVVNEGRLNGKDITLPEEVICVQ